MKRSHAIALLVVLTLFALGFRTAYNKVTRTTIQADARQYAFYAYNLYKYGVYSSEENTTTPKPDSFRSPGYPLFLNLAMRVSGVKGFFDTARMWQAVLSSLMVPLVFLLGVRLGTGDRTALAAATLTAASPHLVTLSSYILTETLFGFLALGAFVLFAETPNRKSLVWAGLTGIVSGCAYLVNEIFLFLPILLILYVFFVENLLPDRSSEKDPGKTVGHRPSTVAAAILALFLIFPVVWTIRNSSDGIPAELSGNQRALNTLAHGSYPGFVYKNPKFKYFPYREDPRIKEYTSSARNFSRIFLERFKERPIRYILWYAFEKPYYIWSWNILQGMGDVYIYPVNQSLFTTNGLANADRVVMKMAHPVLMVACLWGGVLFAFQLISGRNIFNNSRVAWLFLIMLYITFVYTIFASWPRYSIPFRPIFYLVASWSIASTWGILRSRTGEKLIKGND